MGKIQNIEEELGKLRNFVNDEKRTKKKNFRYPFGKKVGKGQKKKNFVTIVKVSENRQISFEKYQIIDQAIMYDMIPRLATADCILYDNKGNPVIILPEWSVEPFSPSKNFNSSIEEGSNINAYRILMAKMLSSITDAKSKASGMLKWIVGGGLALIIGYALITGGGA